MDSVDGWWIAQELAARHNLIDSIANAYRASANVQENQFGECQQFVMSMNHILIDLFAVDRRYFFILISSIALRYGSCWNASSSVYTGPTKFCSTNACKLMIPTQAICTALKPSDQSANGKTSIKIDSWKLNVVYCKSLPSHWALSTYLESKPFVE